MIQVSQLTKHYGPRTAINDLNFEINAGEIVGFLGPNGAGKSTTMKIITGFMPASSGTAKIAGFDVFTHPIEVKRNVGYLPETPPVYLEMTVGDYIEYAAKLHQVPKNNFRSAVDTAIQKTALGDVRKRIIGNLSKGYRQRVGLAQALVHNPKVLILDEPTVGLDPKQIIEIRELIKGLAGDHTVVLSSHILPEVTATCQRIIVISRGKIVAEDSIEQLSRRLKKSASYTLIVKRPDSAFAYELKSVRGVAEVSLTGGRYTIEMESGADEARDEVVSAAVKRGLGVMEFSPDKVSLEEVFLQLTTEEVSA
jgi:ABC-2 type transport system ATP-binding protein